MAEPKRYTFEYDHPVDGFPDLYLVTRGLIATSDDEAIAKLATFVGMTKVENAFGTLHARVRHLSIEGPDGVIRHLAIPVGIITLFSKVRDAYFDAKRTALPGKTTGGYVPMVCVESGSETPADDEE